MAAGLFGILLLLMLALMVRRERAGASALAAADNPIASGDPVPPDLSTMSPRERFDRLYRRVLAAAESGDSATVGRFAPMAFAAYTQLDSVDADARYHAAVLRLHVQGDTAGALRLADSILMVSPGHLFGFLIRGTAARLAGNQAMLRKAHADFSAAWEREMRAGRPEYRDHQTMLDQFRGSGPGSSDASP